MKIAVAALLFLVARSTNAYCNGMGGAPFNYGPRTSKAFPPGWNGLSQTPVRGWRSWYAYYTHMSESMITEVIDALTVKNRTVAGWEGKVSLCDLGYCMAGIDEGWEGCGEGVNGTQHYLNGTPAVAPTFPDMKGLVEYGHSKGVKMGWYFNGCGCIEKREPAAGWGINYEGDIALLAEYGFDSVKFDGCGRMCNMTMYADLMNKTGKAFQIENCHWGDCTKDDASSCPTKDWCPFNWYRTSGDSNNNMGQWYDNLQTTIRFQDWDEPLSQPGCWAYPDMLQVGRLGCDSRTQGCPMPSLTNWSKTHFAAFCIVSSPLVISIVPTDANLEPILDIIGNKQAIAINQAWAGHPGSLVKTLPPAPAPPAKVTTTWQLFPGYTNIYDREPSPTNATHGSLKFVGMFDSTEECFAAVNATSAKDGPFHSFTYNDATVKSAAYAKHCWADTSMTWQGHGGAAGQDSGRGPGFPLVPPTPEVAGVQFWAKPLGGGKTAVLFINGGHLPYPASSITLKELNITTSTVADAATASGLTGAGPTVMDVWTGEDAGPIVDGGWSTGEVGPLNSRFVIITAGAADGAEQ